MAIPRRGLRRGAVAKCLGDLGEVVCPDFGEFEPPTVTAAWPLKHCETPNGTKESSMQLALECVY